MKAYSKAFVQIIRMDFISIRGARTHNLKNLDLEIPRNRLVVITGVSGSGKSSLAFDTLYAEGQRRYVESLSAYARQFLSLMERPDVDSIEGLSPAISIEQKLISHNPRSTVGTVTEVHDYLRLLYARVGIPRCPKHGIDLDTWSVSRIVDSLLQEYDGHRVILLAPIIEERKGSHEEQLLNLKGQGYSRVRIDKKLTLLEEVGKLDSRRAHSLEVVVDRLRVTTENKVRLAESIETALQLAEDQVWVLDYDRLEDDPKLFSTRHACPQCGWSVPELEPRLFSFNSATGACPTCGGLGIEEFLDPEQVITQPSLSLAGGAIRGWNRRNPYYMRLLQSLARHYQFDPETPWRELPAHIQQIVLYGSGEEAIEFQYVSSKGKSYERKHTFSGVLPLLDRRRDDHAQGTQTDKIDGLRTTRPCSECGGGRLAEAPRNVYVGGCCLPSINRLSIDECSEFFTKLRLEGTHRAIAQPVLGEINSRLRFLIDVGLNYLTLGRSAETLSGGEAQRIRLASQIGSRLTGVLYVLDEPSIGLHQRDNRRLLSTLERLRELGNSVVVVEHDRDTILAADHVIDMGPGAGIHGGEILAAGTPSAVMSTPGSLTGDYLTGRRFIAVPDRRAARDPRRVITIRDAHANNLKHVTVDIPIGLFTCVTGLSGSGKSTLILDTLYAAVAQELNRARTTPGAHDRIDGLHWIDKVIAIDQSPIGRTPRSNPATYTGILTPIRELFAATPEARARGYRPGRFSFNIRGGRCEACQGEGLIRVEMHFLPDLFVPCDVCHGSRYNRETLEIKYKGCHIKDVLGMTVEQATRFFSNVPAVLHRLETLTAVGLGYIQLGQSATTLSGGEAQRIKLARELSRRDTGKVLYVLDEPTTGLHFHDINQLLTVLKRLRDHGNTIVVIEHNLDVIKTADWIIDLGPEGGEKGGQVIAAGPPEQIATMKGSFTGAELSPMLTDQPATSPPQRAAHR